MTDRIQFSCPACGKTLVVPMAVAGARGPCPHCAHLVIGPDPARGRPARLAVVNTPWAAQAALPAPGIQTRPDPEPAPAIAREEEALAAAPTAAPAPMTTPAPARPQPAPDSPRASHSSLSPAVLVLSCLLCSGLAFVGGFLTSQYKLGKLTADPKPVDTPATVIPGASVPLKTWLPAENAAPPASGTASNASTAPAASSAGPLSVLRAFLSAPGWAARSAHVLGSDKVHQAMAAHAATYGDGPIETSEISLLQDGEDSQVFAVKTRQIPSGFPVALAKTDKGWLVDWETFSEFHHDRFENFAAKPTDQQESFHLLVNRADSEDSGETASYRLNPPMPGREKLARVSKDSATHSMLDAVFQEQEKIDPESFQQLIAARGLPLVVSLSNRTNGEGQSSLWIEGVTAIGWGPQVPKPGQ